MKKILFALCTGIIISAQAQNKKLPQLGKDPIEKIVAAMTLEEKATLLVGYQVSSDGANIIATAAGTTAPFERFGIPSTYMVDGPSGVRVDTIIPGSDKRLYCTGFPTATLLASTWDTQVLEAVGAAMGDELVEYGYDVLLAPALNIQRNPLCGRNFEYYSEDPLLSGKMTAAMVKGLQSKGGGATIKHFAANSQQSMRMFNDARISQRALREIYLKNFEIAVKESKPWSVMSSYNSLNGEHTQESPLLLTSLLRDEWGFEGIVVTDWGSPKETVTRIHAGNDLMMGGEPRQTQEIIEGVKNGTLSMADVDRNAKHVLKYILQTPSFKKYKASKNPDLKAHAQVSREAAAEGIVLLKNNSEALPLVKEDTIALFGVGSYYFYANGLGSADVNKPYVINMIQGLRNADVKTHPIVDDFYNKYLTAQEIQLKETNIPNWKNWFFGFKRPQEAIIEDFFIAHRAKDCSKAVITISRNAGEALDRENEEGDYLLTRGERELISNVSKIFHARGKKVIVVLNTGGAMDIASWADEVDGIVMAWQPGQEGGNAVADILTGKVNPSGKLPMTLAIDYYDIPSSKNFPQHWKFSWDELLRPGKEVMAKKDLGYTLYEEDIWVGYRHFNTFKKPVAFPFGYGLSYTTFEYGNAKLKKSKNSCIVTIDITNTGKVAGKEAVQLYSTAPKGKLEKPLRELKAFAKTKLLQPGETTTVTMTFQLSDLASFDESIMSWVADKGTYTLSIGASVEDIKASLSLDMKKSLIQKVPTKIQH